MKVLEELKGHSGAKVLLCTDGSANFIRKVAGGPSRNARLAGQAAKQREAASRGILCPAVYREGEQDDGCYYFDMEFMPGSAVSHMAVESAALFKRDQFRDFLHATVSDYRGRVIGEIPPQAFIDKLHAIERQTLANAAVTELHDVVRRITADMRALDWPALPETECHGDLTLENIMFTSTGRFTLIDFDVVELSSAFLDLCKVLQDTSGLWCLRRMAIKQPVDIAFLNARMALERLESVARGVAEELFPEHSRHVFLFASLHLMRTLPYCTEKDVGVFTLQNVMSLLSRTPPAPR